jgi:citrate lyase beta subunit
MIRKSFTLESDQNVFDLENSVNSMDKSGARSTLQQSSNEISSIWSSL